MTESGGPTNWGRSTEQAWPKAAFDNGCEASGLTVTVEAFEGRDGGIMGPSWQAPEMWDGGQIEGRIQCNCAHELIPGGFELPVPAAKVTFERIESGAFFRRGEVRIRQRVTPCRFSYLPDWLARAGLAHNPGGFLLHRTHRSADWFQMPLDGEPARSLNGRKRQRTKSGGLRE